MDPRAQIDQDLATSMKEGMVARTSVLRLLKASMQNEQIKLGHELSAGEMLKVLQREAKQRRDSIEQYRAGGRDDLADLEQHELDVITAYLPTQMSADEIGVVVDEVIADLGAEGQSQMGIVIGAVMKQLEGKADGATVSQVVRSRLVK